MQFGLTQEQELIVSTVRSFVENEIYPHEAEVERTGEVPEALAASIKQKVLDLGFYACNFPEECGWCGPEPCRFHPCGTGIGARLDGTDPFLWATAEHSDGLWMISNVNAICCRRCAVKEWMRWR